MGELPRTPGPYLPSAFGEQQRMLNKLQSAATGQENIVVSVGLLLLDVGGRSGEEEKRCWFCVGAGEDVLFGWVHIGYFVFNQSGWPRSLEVTCPGERRRGKGGRGGRRRGGGV